MAPFAVRYRILAMVAYAIVAHVAVHRGDHTVARRTVDTALAELEVSGPARFGLPWLLWAHGLLVEAQGDNATALAVLEGAWALTAGVGLPADCYELAPDLVRLAMGAGRRALADAIADEVERLAARMATASARATAMRCRGLAGGDVDLLAHAVAVLASSGRVVEQARAAEDAGRVALTERREKAASFLVEAASRYERLGARRDAAPDVKVPIPKSEWTVGDAATHLVVVFRFFTDAVEGRLEHWDDRYGEGDIATWARLAAGNDRTIKEVADRDDPGAWPASSAPGCRPFWPPPPIGRPTTRSAPRGTGRTEPACSGA